MSFPPLINSGNFVAKLVLARRIFPALGKPMRHDEKYLLINQSFADKQRLVPFFNRSINEDLSLVIQSAGVSRGRNGFFL